MRIKKSALENPELDRYVEATRAVLEKHVRKFAAVEYALDAEPGSFLGDLLQCFIDDYDTADAWAQYNNASRPEGEEYEADLKALEPIFLKPRARKIQAKAA